MKEEIFLGWNLIAKLVTDTQIMICVTGMDIVLKQAVKCNCSNYT